MRMTIKTKLLTVLLALCVVLTLIPATALAAGVNYIDRITVTYDYIKYKAGDEPRATASVTEGNCVVAYEYWRELEQKEAGGVWSGTGRYWYSDPAKMNSLAADKRITKFEAGHHYGYNIVLTTKSGAFIGDNTVVSVGDHEWGKAGSHTNLKITEMSTKLNIYGIYAIDLPEDVTDKVITGVSIIEVNKDLNASTPIKFTAKSASQSAGQYDIIEEAWEIGGSLNDIIKSTDAASRAPIAGGEYWYSIVLKAKDGYVFSKDFSGSHNMIKEGSGVTFELNGILYNGRFGVSDDGKTLTAWEFMNPVTVSASGAAHDYRITDGANGVWAKSSNGTLAFTANGDISKLTDIKIDGNVISADNYTLTGSTVITLKQEYLSTLSAGKHTLTVVYSDGECDAEFEITAAQNSGGTSSGKTNDGDADKSPDTGDSSKLLLWVLIIVVSGAGAAGAVVYLKKKKSVVK